MNAELYYLDSFSFELDNVDDILKYDNHRLEDGDIMGILTYHGLKTFNSNLILLCQTTGRQVMTVWKVFLMYGFTEKLHFKTY